MPHARTLLRNAAAAAIATPPTPLIAGRVFAGRVWPHDPGALPAARVFTDSEQLVFPLSMTEVQRTVALRVEIIATGLEGVIDDAIDDACEEVESRLSAALTVGGRSVRPVYQTTDIELDRDGERVTARAVLTYRVDLFTQSSAPGTLA